VPVPPDLIHAADTAARPARPETLERATDALFAAPNSPFFFVFYPKHRGNWKVETIQAGQGIPDEDVGTWWLPVLQQEPVQPGVNGNHTLVSGANPEHQYDTAHVRIKRRGGIILSHDLGYMKEREVTHPRTKLPGVAYLEAWSELRPGLPDQRPKLVFDRTRYNRWLLWLMREGYLPAPDAMLLDVQRGRVAKRAPRRATVAHPDPALKATYVQEARDKEAQVAAAVVPEQADPVPAKKRPAYKRVN